MREAIIEVPEIHCDHCRMSLEGAVGSLPGVSQAQVSVETRTVDVSFDDARTSMVQIVEAIEGQGYEVAGL